MDTSDSEISNKIGNKSAAFFIGLTCLVIFFGIVGFVTMPPLSDHEQYPECFNEDGSDKGTCSIDHNFLQVYIFYGLNYTVHFTQDKFNNITESLTFKN